MKVVLYLKHGYGPHGPLQVKTRDADWPVIPREGQTFFRHVGKNAVAYKVDYIAYDDCEEMNLFQVSIWATKIEAHQELSDDYSNRYFVIRVKDGKVSVTSLSKRQLQERLHSDLSEVEWRDSFEHVEDAAGEGFCCIIRGGVTSHHGVLRC